MEIFYLFINFLIILFEFIKKKYLDFFGIIEIYMIKILYNLIIYIYRYFFFFEIYWMKYVIMMILNKIIINIYI